MIREAAAPYVISSDVRGLLEKWAPTRSLKIPQNGTLESLRDELRQTLTGYFHGGIEVIDEAVIRSGLIAFLKTSQTEAISLDRAYIDQQDPNVIGYIDLTRGVDEHFNTVGMRPRPNTLSEKEQFDRFATQDTKRVALVDDVLFNGDSVPYIAQKLAERNRPVTDLFVGISIGIGKKVVEGMGIAVHSVLDYNAVEDEVCERDFRIGVPMSGRTVFSTDGEIYSAPYIAPFGDAGKWASIPSEHIADFSLLCVEQSVVLWSAIEKTSDRRVTTSELPRQVKGLANEKYIVDALKRLK